MNKTVFRSALAISVFAFIVPAQAQQAKIPKIGWLLVRPVASSSVVEGGRRELGALGYVEGTNVVFEYRSADNKSDRLPTLADELVRLKVDVIIAAALNEAIAAKNATR